jgi:hypothetical protein
LGLGVTGGAVGFGLGSRAGAVGAVGVDAVDGDLLGAAVTMPDGEGSAAEATTQPVSDTAARTAAAHRVSVVNDTG